MKSIQEMIAVMEASKTKEIECRHKGLPADTWVATKLPSWDWSTFDYRVKAQEPRRVWVASDMIGNSWVLKCPNSTLSNAAEYVELTPDVKSRLGLT